MKTMWELLVSNTTRKDFSPIIKWTLITWSITIWILVSDSSYDLKSLSIESTWFQHFIVPTMTQPYGMNLEDSLLMKAPMY